MSFEIQCKKFKDALSKMSSALGNDLSNVSVKITKKGTRLAAQGRGLSVEITIAEVTGSEEFCIGHETLTRLMTNRKVLACKIKDSDLHFNEGRFKGNVTVMPYIAVEVEPDNDDKAITIPPTSGVATHFNQARSVLQLTDLTQPDKEAFLSVRVKDGRITCLVFDKTHFGRYESEVEYKETLEFNILDSTLRKIMAMTKGAETPYTLRIGQSSVFVEAEDVKASIAMEQADDKAFANYIGLIDVLLDNKSAKALIKGDQMTTVIGNMMAIVESGVTIGLAIDKGMKMDYSTAYGKISEAFETKSKGSEKLKLSPDLLMDITGTMPTEEVEVAISFNPNSSKKIPMLVITAPSANVVYVCLSL